MAARRVQKSPALRVVRDTYELDKWAKGMVSEQRRRYFELIDAIVEKLGAISRTGGPPTDEQIMEAIGWGLAEDDSLTSHVMPHGGTALTSDDEWDKIFSAAAGAVLQEHATAVDKGEWP